jgi:Amt family ammonium transporter
MKVKLLLASILGSLVALAPAAALAADAPPDPLQVAQSAAVGADTVWVVVAAVLVMFMQAGFAMLEVGFSRMKNVGTVVA